MRGEESGLPGPLGRKQLLELFEELSTELGMRGARAHVYLFGGAAMSVAFDRDRRTVDLDVRVDSGREKLLESVRAVGRRHGFEDGWFNEPLAVVLPRGADERAGTLYQSPYLTVTGASAQHLLAMKLVAGRFKDREDIAVLCKELGVRNEGEAIRIKDEVLPGVPLHRAAREALRRVFEDGERKVESVTLVGDQPANLPCPSALATGAVEARVSQSRSQVEDSSPSWKDKVKSELGVGDQSVNPPRPSDSAAAAEAGQRRGHQRQGPQQ